MSVPMKTIIDCSTGVVSEVPLTDEEMAQRELDAQKAEADRVAREAADKAKADAKASAEAKLAALGLTSDEVNAILA